MKLHIYESGGIVGFIRLLGILLPLFGFIPGLLLIAGILQAKQLDKTVPIPIVSIEHPCDEWADFTPTLSKRVMSENESVRVNVSVVNRGHGICDMQTALINSSFDMSPSEKTQVVSLGPAALTSITCILTPKKTGTFEIGASVGPQIKYVGITVTSALGFISTQMAIISILSAILGPAITIPFWFGFRKARKEREEKAWEKENNKRSPFE